MTTPIKAPVANFKRAKIPGIGPGQERFTFLYVVIAAAGVAFVMTVTSLAGLGWQHRFLMLTGVLIVGGAILFSALEIRRLTQTEEERARDTADAARTAYPAGDAVVEPPTAEACPHHEDHVESPGLDQGQLTSQLPDDTPLIAELFAGRGKR